MRRAWLSTSLLPCACPTNNGRHFDGLRAIAFLDIAFGAHHGLDRPTTNERSSELDSSVGGPDQSTTRNPVHALCHHYCHDTYFAAVHDSAALQCHEKHRSQLCQGRAVDGESPFQCIPANLSAPVVTRTQCGHLAGFHHFSGLLHHTRPGGGHRWPNDFQPDRVSHATIQ